MEIMNLVAFVGGRALAVFVAMPLTCTWAMGCQSAVPPTLSAAVATSAPSPARSSSVTAPPAAATEPSPLPGHVIVVPVAVPPALDDCVADPAGAQTACLVSDPDSTARRGVPHELVVVDNRERTARRFAGLELAPRGGLAWALDGQAVYGLTAEDGGSVVGVKVADGTVTELTAAPVATGTALTGNIQVLRDGRVAYVSAITSSETGRVEVLAVRPSEAAAERLATVVDTPAWQTAVVANDLAMPMAVSADGRLALALGSGIGGGMDPNWQIPEQHGVYILDPSSDAPPVFMPAEGAADVSWSPDGQRLVVVTFTGDGRDVFVWRGGTALTSLGASTLDALYELALPHRAASSVNVQILGWDDERHLRVRLQAWSAGYGPEINAVHAVIDVDSGQVAPAPPPQ